MDDENDDRMFIDPEILKKELVISLPILNESDIERMINGAESSEEESSSSTDDRGKEKPCLKRDERRFSLLNNPNYGIILCFMDKFRTFMNIKDYPLRILEDNLISEQEKISQRFIDFHLNLLKKISSGKTVKRDQFASSMTNFAYRSNRDDGDHLAEYGYSKARIDIKLRILKDLLEKQFDRNQTLKTAVADKPPFEIRAKPFGRDRFGASYWLFTDTDCFIRVFRENIDANRTWTNLAKNQQELENLIKLLITDYIVRKKYPEWKFSYESFNSLSPSNEFEEQYSPNPVDIEKKNEIMDELNSSSVLFRSNFIQTGDIDLDPIVNLDRDLSSSPPLSSFIAQTAKRTRNFLLLSSDQESINSVEISGKRLISSSSTDSKDEIYSSGRSQDFKKSPKQNVSTNNVQVITIKPSLEQGIKRKLVDYDDSESEIEGSEKNDEASQDAQQIPAKPESKTNVDLPIALRRPKRGQRRRFAELSPDSSSTGISVSQNSRRKKSGNDDWKSYSQSLKTNGRRRRRGGRKSMNAHSSTTSDDHQLSDDDDFADDYLPNNAELDLLLNGDLLDEEDDDDDYSPRRTAKTVAQCQISLKPCCTCSRTDRPESLLLCEDCDDAYHLECVRPELLSIPDGDWYCPVCEHKCLCDGLIEKLLILIKDEEKFEMKRRLYVSKRRKRLTNVTVNLDRYVQQPTIKRQTNGIVSSDGEENERKTNSTIDDDDDDDDSVYGRKAIESRKSSNKKEEEEEEEKEQTGKRGVRSCRRKAQSYCLEDYDKKIKEAMKDAGVHKALIEVDSDDSDDIVLKRPSKKRPRYEWDDDFDASDGKSDADFVPSQRRITNDDSRNNSKENYDNDDNDFNDFNDDFNASDDDIVSRNRRQSSGSSIVKKTKPTPTPNRNNRRKTMIKSSDDSILSEANQAI